MKTLVIGEKREAMCDMALAIGDPGFPKKPSLKEKEAFHDKGSANGFVEGEKYIFTWAAGHLFQYIMPSEINPLWGLKQLLPKPTDYMLKDLRTKMVKKPDYSNNAKKKALNTLKTLLAKNNYDVLINAADGDAEGEAIVRDIINFLMPDEKKKTVKMYRVWNTFAWGSEATIAECISKMKPYNDAEYVRWYDSQLARSQSDYLVGVKTTKALTDFGGGGGVLSAGRVQSFCLHLACQREEEIAEYEKNGPSFFYTLEARFGETDFKHYYLQEIDGKYVRGREYKNKRLAHMVLDDCEKNANNAKVLKVIKEEKSTTVRPLPLSGSKFANIMMKKYKITLGECNDILNYLRTAGFTTYPGTNGTYFATSDSIDVKAAMEIAERYFGLKSEGFSLKAGLFNDKEAAKANHPPLSLKENTPTQADIEKWKNAKNEKGKHIPCVREGYELIAKHILVHFMPSDLYIQYGVDVECAGHLFDASGRKPITQGWRTLMEMEISDTSLKTTAQEGETFTFDLIEAKEGKTRQPKQHSISSILSLMLDPLSYIDDLIAEERNEQKLLKLKSYKKILKDVHGIGTDRTRENILNTIKERGYWTLDKKGIITVTPLGWQVERALPEALKSIATTATWEIKFEEIRRGEFAFSKFIEVVDNTVMNVYIRGVFEYYQKNGFNPPKKKISNETELKCPLCGALIIEKTGAFVCSTQKYKNNKKSGCLFSIAKNQKLLEATIGLAQLQKLLAGHKLTAKNGKILSMDLENEYFTKIEGGNSPIKKEEEVGKVIETTKTFRLGGTELFVYKNQFGKDLTLKQASLVLAGEEVELKRTSKAGKPFSVTIWLEEGGKCGHSFSQ